jgi:cell wall-associated NlpC family hydrolase
VVDNRKRITNYARTLLGSHYLWGSGGSTPGHANGARYKRDLVTWADSSIQPSSVALYAAKCNAQGLYVCAGRYKKANGQVVSSNDVHLKNALDSFDNLQEALWGSWYFRLTPRLVQGEGVDEAGKVVFGENCYDVRHFDCISFINYVLSETTISPDAKSGWSGSIQHWSHMWTTEVKLEAPAAAGDILIRYYDDAAGHRHFTHIAFLDSDNHVVQAERAIMGVHADDLYHPTAWQARRRLEERYIYPDRSDYA